MAVVKKELARVFIVKVGNQEISLEDPNPNFSAEQVMELYSAQYPQLLNATIQNAGIENEKITYRFNTVAGTKG